MRTVAAGLFLLGLLASPIEAQERRGRYGERAHGVPPGHLPPPGECRVWYDNRPAGHQPPPTSCREAERVASRDPYARVIYGGGDRRDEGWWDRDHERGDRGRAIPRRSPYPYPDGDRYPDRFPYPEGRYPDRYPGDRGEHAYGGVPFDNGYKDGYEKGRDDARENDAYEPRRHSRYRSADRGYDRRYGSKENYKDTYREGFRAGYDEGYRAAYGPDQRGGRVRLPWPY